ncbi:MAG: hypothetical protein RBU37_28325, partial [Myxococcota bacterium]|nr:hypothetical protein [Myxococcota bacterium]
MGEAYALAAISAACRFLPLALLLPVPLGAARWSVRLSVGLLLVFLGSVYLAPELQGARFAPSALLLDCAYGFTLAVALSMVLPVGTLFGAILDAHVPEWRSERPFGRLVELLV